MAKRPPARKSELEQVLERIAALEARVAHLEGMAGAAAGAAADFDVALPTPAAAAPAEAAPLPAPAPSPALPVVEAGVTEEVLVVLSAAVAAFLGERAHIKQVRLLHSDAWAQQGRVSVMASHRWAVQRG